MRKSLWDLCVSGVLVSLALTQGCGGSASSSDDAGSGNLGSSSSGSGPGNSSGASGGSSSGTSGGTSTSSSGGGSGSSSGTGAGSSSSGTSSGNTGSSGAGSSSSGSSGSSGSSSSGSFLGNATCPADSALPPEPVDPPLCTTLMATRSTPDETGTLDTARIQSALNACGAGKAVKLTSSGANNAFVTGVLAINGTTLMVDAGTTLYASRNPSSYGSGCTPSAAANACGSVITVTGTNAGIVGSGIIDGQGGEPIIGQSQSWWDISVGLRPSNGSAPNPALISVSNATNFVMHNIHIFNSPKFHVKLASAGFKVWGVEVLTPSKKTNSAGAALTPYGARNTDGIDPGGSSTTNNGYIVCSKISVGDDEVAIKGSHAAVTNLTIAHNHFGTGHGMSIGSETNAGVSGIKVYDLTIDGSIPTGGSPASDVNGIRIKSDVSRGGVVDGVTYTDVCMRNLNNPILLNPNYTAGATGTLFPFFKNITLKNIHALTTGVSQVVTLDGLDSMHISGVTLDDVVVDGNPTVTATNAAITIASGGVSFPPPTGAGVTVTGAPGTPAPIDCSSRWVAFP